MGTRLGYGNEARVYLAPFLHEGRDFLNGVASMVVVC